jgi:hypothetical protein
MLTPELAFDKPVKKTGLANTWIEKEVLESPMRMNLNK